MKIYIKAPEIFGGEDREGGVEGCADWLNGEPTQTTNEYLIQNVGTPIPAFRGVSSLVLNQAYVSAFNPYLKNWEFWVTRIQTRQNGLAQWYPEKADIETNCQFELSAPAEKTNYTYQILSAPNNNDIAVWQPPEGVGFIDLLLVGDGGAGIGTSGTGGSAGGAGGGGGQVLLIKNVPVSGPVEYQKPVKPSNNVGFSRRFGSYEAKGGGKGQSGYWSCSATAYNGGGGTFAYNNAIYSGCLGNGGTKGGEPAGVNVFSTRAGYGGGGGGMGSGGGDAFLLSPSPECPNCGSPGFGGAGIFVDEFKSFGENGWFGGGGGGAGQRWINETTSSISYSSAGGIGGGGKGGLPTETGTAGIDGTGGGGGGVPRVTTSLENKGGDGIILIRYVESVEPSQESGLDMNPAHIIRECLTDPDWGMGYAESDIDDTSFVAAANMLYAEGMGISTLWDRENTLEAFVQDIVRHIDAALYVNRSTGKFVLKLIRDDYDPEAIITLGPSEIESVENYRRPAFGELINAVTVNYWSCSTGKQASVGVQEIALVQTQGGTIGATIEYPGFTNSRNALRAAQRDLRALSLPLLSCTIYANRAAASLDIGDTFKLEWPDYHAGAVIMRVTGMAFGDGRTDRIRIECVEDVFAAPEEPVIAEPENLWINPTRPPDPIDGGDPQDPPPEEPPPPLDPEDSEYVPPGSDDLGPEPPAPPQDPETRGQALVTEAPFYLLARSLGDTDARAILAEDNGAGFLATAAGKPSGAQRYQIWVDRGDGFVQTRNAEFAPFANLRSAIGFTDTTIALKNRRDFNRAVSGRFGQIGDEIIVFESTSAQSMIVRRGALDTVPQQHPVNTPVWIWQDWAGSDQVQYTSNELINVKLISVNGSGQTQSETVPQYLRFRSRANRPYPPGNVKINGEAYPVLSDAFGLAVTWSHRDRLQQTAAVIEDTTYGDIGPEDGTTYSIGLFDDTDNPVDFDSGLTTTTWDWVPPSEFPEGEYTLKLWSVRDGYASWQTHEISVLVQTPAGSESEVFNLLNEPLVFDCSSDQPVLDDPLEFVCEV